SIWRPPGIRVASRRHSASSHSRLLAGICFNFLFLCFIALWTFLPNHPRSQNSTAGKLHHLSDPINRGYGRLSGLGSLVEHLPHFGREVAPAIGLSQDMPDLVPALSRVVLRAIDGAVCIARRVEYFQSRPELKQSFGQFAPVHAPWHDHVGE